MIGLLLFLVSVNVHGVLRRPVAEDGGPTEVQVVGAALDVDKIKSAKQIVMLNFKVAFGPMMGICLEKLQSWIGYR